MITYQDLLAKGDSDLDRIDFVYYLINAHKSSDAYKDAVIADEYARQQNRTIMWYTKLLYTITGEAVPDNFSANYKLCSNFFYRFITQETQYLLGNGTTWGKSDTSEKLGSDFDTRLQHAAYEALVAGVSFGFWNYDHLEVFKLTEFVPLYDEENGALMAGVRFWQIDQNKPLRATLYELDGYTEFIWRRRKENQSVDFNGTILHEKRPYVLQVRTSEADGIEIYDGENYPSFPIVPLYANQYKQSELVGLRSEIDAYDLIRSGFANDLDDASQIYWTIQNAGGMDDVDLVEFIRHMKTVKAAVVDDDGARAESHTIEVPYVSRETLLTRLRADMYEDFMALDTKIISGGATTATQIKAAYEPLNSKTDMFEYCVLDFLDGILAVAGIEDSASFTRSLIINTQEEIQTVIQSAAFLSPTYVTTKILELLGDADQTEDVLAELLKAEMEQAAMGVSNELLEGSNGSDAEGDSGEGQ